MNSLSTVQGPVVDRRSTYNITGHLLSALTIFGWLALLSGNAGAQTCSFVISPASIYLDSSAQSATISLTASDPSCPWTATAVGSFLSITSAAQGTGSGAVTVGVAANTTGSDLAGSLQVGGQALPVTQRFTATAFTDVPPSAYYFDAVSLLSAKMITTGCAVGLYCPTEDVTRAQMAIFIVRAVMGGNNFTFSPTPYFTDVPVGAFGFQWIQKMFELGITTGCGPSLYCPNDSVTRAEMAVFIIRARYGATTAFDYTQTPYFTDVPTGAFAFNSIQRMKEDNITSGCSLTTYCPDNPVTRGDMAIFIMRGTFDQLLPPTEPVITQVSPSTVPAGQPATLAVTGLNTNFVQGTTTVSPIPGFTLGTLTVTSPTTLQVSVTAGATLSTQPESVWVKTNTEEAVEPNAISVIASSQQQTLTSITVSPSTATVLAGGTQQFTAQGLYSDNSSQDLTSQATWAVTPSTVATVTSAGLATGIAPGSAKVNASVLSIFGTASLSVAAPSSVTITGPVNLTFLNTSPTTVNGTVSDPSAIINVNGIPTPNSGGAFSVSVPLLEGNNAITATAQSASGVTSAATIQVTLDTTPPRATIYSPSNGTVTSDSTVTVTGIVNDTVVGTVNNEQVTLTVNGVAAQVANRSFLAPGIPLALGANTITAVATDHAGNSYTTSISVTRNAPTTQPQIELISGTNQSATVSSQTPAPLVVALVDGSGHPVSGVSVIFKVTQNNGMLTASGSPAGSLQLVTTDSNGQAQATWTLGTHSGAASDMVQAYAVGYSGVISFSATALQSQASMIVVDSGNTQTGAAGQALPLPFIAVVTDSGFNRLANVPVTFTVQKGGGTINGGTTYTTNSDSDGRVQAALALGLQEGIGNNLVTANFAGNTSFPASFVASGMVAGAAANTTVTGVVLDNSSNPLAGVTIQAVPLSQVAQAPGSVSTAPSFLTNAQGQFTVTGAPVGSIRLMVNGGTAQSPNHYPDLEYSMVTIAGQANTVGMPIYLIQLDTVNQLCVSETQGGTLTLPQSPGFSLTVLPGSVTFPGGSRQGCLSVTPVHGDKVPMVPGFGQQPRFIVTIQPTGAIFNPPAAITLPNVDGLPARSVTEMYSYDHDLASFVSIGNGTVSADGTVIASNPGVGVLKAGWHCGGNPNSAGTVASCGPCATCDGTNCQPTPSLTGQPCQNPCLATGQGTCSAQGYCAGQVLVGAPCGVGGTCDQNGSCSFPTAGGGGCGNCNSGNPCIDDSCVNGQCVATPNTLCQMVCNGLATGASCTAGGVIGTCDTAGNCNTCASLGAGGSCVSAGVIGVCDASGRCCTGDNCPPELVISEIKSSSDGDIVHPTPASLHSFLGCSIVNSDSPVLTCSDTISVKVEVDGGSADDGIVVDVEPMPASPQVTDDPQQLLPANGEISGSSGSLTFSGLSLRLESPNTPSACQADQTPLVWPGTSQVCPSNPLAYTLTATATVGGTQLKTTLPAGENIAQDFIDTLREEYIDFGSTVFLPTREQIAPPPDPLFNWGYYQITDQDFAVAGLIAVDGSPGSDVMGPLLADLSTNLSLLLANLDLQITPLNGSVQQDTDQVVAPRSVPLIIQDFSNGQAIANSQNPTTWTGNTDPQGDDLCNGQWLDPSGNVLTGAASSLPPVAGAVCIAAILAGPNGRCDTTANNRAKAFSLTYLHGIISSAYRNPQKQFDVGSTINSYHTRGRALDFAAVDNLPASSVTGKTSDQIRCLIQAAAIPGTNQWLTPTGQLGWVDINPLEVFSEKGAQQNEFDSCDNAMSDHVHVAR